jgi:hypothetical protein
MAPSAAIRCAPLLPSSSAVSSQGWNRKRTRPGSFSFDSNKAAPNAMAVCASWPQACMAPGVCEDIFVLVLFEDGQRVHVRADGDQFAALADLRDDAGLPDPAPDPVPHLFQLVCDNLRGTMQVEADLRVHVEIAPPFDEFFRNRV